MDFAVTEMQAAAKEDPGSWSLAETAQLFTDTGHYDRAIEAMKRSVPSYFAVDIPNVARASTGRRCSLVLTGAT